MSIVRTRRASWLSSPRLTEIPLGASSEILLSANAVLKAG